MLKGTIQSNSMYFEDSITFIFRVVLTLNTKVISMKQENNFKEMFAIELTCYFNTKC